jgi:hypothetical protein
VKFPTKASYTYSSLQLYTAEVGKLKMVKINSAFFDFYLLVANLAWLSLVYLLISVIPDENINAIEKVIKGM